MHINIHKPETRLSQLVERMVAGEEIILDSDSEPVAKLIPYKKPGKAPRCGGQWKGKVWIADDFDELPPELAKAFGIYAG